MARFTAQLAQRKAKRRGWIQTVMVWIAVVVLLFMLDEKAQA